MAKAKQKPKLPAVVVLTGTIGSGKSTVAAMLAELGAGVVNADELAREVVRPGSPALSEIVSEFGDVLGPSGELDRRKLAEIVFSDPAKRARLEQMTHPRIRELATRRLAEEQQAGKPLVVYDCPLFFEARLPKEEFGEVIVVSADEQTCLARIVARDGMSEEQARLRLKQQIPIGEKVKLADYVIENSGTAAELKKKVKALFKRLEA